MFTGKPLSTSGNAGVHHRDKAPALAEHMLIDKRETINKNTAHLQINNYKKYQVATIAYRHIK